MVLYIVGLGLGDHTDITVRGLAAVKKCKDVWLEAYTSVLEGGVDAEALAAFYGRPVRVATRETVETDAEAIIGSCVHDDIALLVVGDPLCATTHTDIALRARKLGATVEFIQNASVMGAVACCGLQLYRYGQTVSIPYFDGEWRPTSFYEKIEYNRKGDMHTLCLLDIKVREPDYEALAKTCRTSFLPPRFMTVNQAIEQLFVAEDQYANGACARTARAVGLARLGQPTQRIVQGTLEELSKVDFGGPLHSLVICAPNLHEIEEEYLVAFAASAAAEAAAA
ncbi:diphthine synthase [Pelagophyceae sp. CCMP2097]|nr:diphthine synthase [Pelagophyceae sp. CCMP2097]